MKILDWERKAAERIAQAWTDVLWTGPPCTVGDMKERTAQIIAQEREAANPVADMKRMGGRGECDQCGKTVNNVAYHREHDCVVARLRACIRELVDAATNACADDPCWSGTAMGALVDAVTKAEEVTQ